MEREATGMGSLGRGVVEKLYVSEHELYNQELSYLSRIPTSHSYGLGYIPQILNVLILLSVNGDKK